MRAGLALAAVLATSPDAAAGAPYAPQGSVQGSSDAFAGYAVAVAGNTTAVGAFNDPGDAGDAGDAGASDGNGAVYVFVQSGSTWALQQKLVASDAAASDEFGYSVALSGDTLLIGAPGKNDGVAYAFNRSGGAWAQAQEIAATDGTGSDDCFGCSIAVQGSTAVFGAPGRLGNVGAAYVYGLMGTWQYENEFLGSNAGDLFGFSVGLSPDATTAVAGIPGASNETGEADVFTKSGPSWSSPTQVTLQAADGRPLDTFGYSVSAGNGEILIGAYQSQSTGAAYVFTGGGTAWSLQSKLLPSDGTGGDFFGYAVALSGTTALIGAHEKGGQRGAAYVFASSTSGAWTQSELAAPGAGQSFGYSVALSGANAVVGAFSADNDSGAAYFYGAPPALVAPALGRPLHVLWLALSLTMVGATVLRRTRWRT
jgi:hypothetical protein